MVPSSCALHNLAIFVRFRVFIVTHRKQLLQGERSSFLRRRRRSIPDPPPLLCDVSEGEGGRGKTKGGGGAGGFPLRRRRRRRRVDRGDERQDFSISGGRKREEWGRAPPRPSRDITAENERGYSPPPACGYKKENICRITPLVTELLIFALYLPPKKYLSRWRDRLFHRTVRTVQTSRNKILGNKFFFLLHFFEITFSCAIRGKKKTCCLRIGVVWEGGYCGLAP